MPNNYAVGFSTTKLSQWAFDFTTATTNAANSIKSFTAAFENPCMICHRGIEGNTGEHGTHYDCLADQDEGIL